MTEVKKMEDVVKKDPIFEDCEPVNKEDMIGETIIIEDAKFLPSSYGDNDFAVARLKGNKSMSLGSNACVDKLRKCVDGNMLPVETKLVRRKSKTTGNLYWDFE
jgi:hypothetical protein